MRGFNEDTRASWCLREAWKWYPYESAEKRCMYAQENPRKNSLLKGENAMHIGYLDTFSMKKGGEGPRQ